MYSQGEDLRKSEKKADNCLNDWILIRQSDVFDQRQLECSRINSW